MANDKSGQSISVAQQKCASLKDFLQRADNKPAREVSSLAVRSSVGAVLASSYGLIRGRSVLTNAESEKFAQGAAELVVSTEFTNELSDAIGQPGAAESEDEFVARAKEKMRGLLRGKLLK